MPNIVVPRKIQLDDGWPESAEEHSKKCKYEDLVARNINMRIHDDVRYKEHGADLL